MFALGRPLNPYDEIIVKATDEKQTEINWEIALTVWDKVNEDGETGARNCVQALQKRLNHRSANVQLFSLTLAGALVNNCGPALHREISGKTFTQTLVRLINDRTTHDTVRRSALSTLETIIKEHPADPNFDLLLETYESLKRQGVVFPSSSSSGAGGPGSGSGAGRDEERERERKDEDMRREEEDLQRALAESAALADPMRGFQKRGGGSATSRSPDPYSSSGRPSEGSFAPPSSSSSSSALPSHDPARKTPQRVRALFDFQGQTAEELQLQRGEEVRVLEEVSGEWWRGESMDGRGRVGIFPVNYVEPLPDFPPAPTHAPSSSSSSRQPSYPHPHQQQQQQPESDEDLEASIFAQAASLDRLLALMHTLRARGEDFAESEELTDLYNSSMRLRPKVVQLLRKYEQKQADLHSLSDKVQHAKATYEQYVGIAPPPQQAQQQQQQQQQPYGYAQQQPQQNGFHPHPQPQPQQQQQQQHAPPPLTASSPAPYAQAQSAQVDPAHAQAQAQMSDEQREYERKYAEYLRQMEEYQRQVAQVAQQQQQQQQQQHQGPPPSVGSPAPLSAPAAAPSSVGSPTPAAAQQPSQSQPQQQQQPQPVWDPQSGQWVWPTQHAAPPPVAAVGAAAAVPGADGYLQQGAQAPAPALSPVTVPAQGQGYPAQAQPYQAQAAGAGAGGAAGLEGGMAALSVSGPSAEAQAGGGYYPQQQRQPLDPQLQQQQQQQQEHAAAWAAYHAAQAQAQAQQQQGAPLPQ
ncbi:hypothetical protein JCM6882_007629 [Rhodosporidiobolus microsporus]